MRELVRAFEDEVRKLEDDERAASAFLGLGLFGVVTWFGSLLLADTLLPATTIGALLAVLFGLVGWRAAKRGVPREATTFVGVVLALALAVLWPLFLFSLVFRLA